jgi:hypothetical protein
MSTDMFPQGFIDYMLKEGPMGGTAYETCTQCGNDIRVQIMRGTGVCSDDCRKERDGDTPHPTTMPPHQKMGYTKPEVPSDELDGVLMDAPTSEGTDLGSIH